MLKYAIVGFGGLGKLHFGNEALLLEKAGGVKLVALCDIDESSFYLKTETNLGASDTYLNLEKYNLYTDVDKMLEAEELDFVISALPTYIHEQIAVKIMNKGIHLFSEKPMALTLEQAQNMLEASEKNNVKLMIGHCVRYMPAYKMLKEMINSGRFGKVVKADFSRVSGTPIWGYQNWFVDESKSGGVPIDLHIHDVDYINHAFGKPDSITSAATHTKTKFDSIYTIYKYGDTIVTAKADWGMPSAIYPFSCSFVARFEKATVEFKDDIAMLYTEDGEARELVLPESTPYLDEIIDFVTNIREDKKSTLNPAEDSILSLKIALLEKQSALTGETISI